MRRGFPLPPRLVGVLTGLFGAVALVLAFQPPVLPWDRPLRVQVEVPAAVGALDSGAGVQMSGVKVGRVAGVERRRGREVVDVEVERRYAGLLHADAGALIRPHGLLGPKYMELRPGSTGRLQDGAYIPGSRVQISVDVDEVLNTLQPDVRDSLKIFFTEMGTASQGRGDDMNTALKALGASADNLATVTGTLHRRDEDLTQFFVSSETLNRDVQFTPVDQNLADTNKVLSGLVDVEDSIGGSIDHTASVLQKFDIVLRGNERNLATVLGQAPTTVSRARTALQAGSRLLSVVDPCIPALMAAVVETESSFSSSDANGNYVRVYSLGADTQAGPPQPGTSAGHSTCVPGTTNSGPLPHVSDQQMVNIILGN